MTIAAYKLPSREVDTREEEMVSEKPFPSTPSASDSGFLNMEEPERFSRNVLHSLAFGAASALAVWIVWAASALILASMGNPDFGAATRAGVLLGGGAGLGAGAFPLFPAITIGLSVMAARAWLAALRAGKVAVAPSLSRSSSAFDSLVLNEAPKVRVAAKIVPPSPVLTSIQFVAAGAIAGSLPYLFGARTAFAIFVAGLILGFVLTRQPVAGTRPGARRLAIPAVGLTTLAGVATIEAIASHGWLEAFLPGPLPLMAYGAGMGGFFFLGGAIAHLSAPSDPVKAHYHDKCQGLQGELRDVARKASDTYRAASEILKARAGDRAEALRLRDRMASVTHRVLDLAAQCQAVSAAVGEETELHLAREIAELDRKVDAAKDEVARSHYERARSTLETQKAQLDRIRLGRDRAVATMYSQLALLERTRLSLIGVQSSDAARLMTELSVLSESLGDAGDAMDSEAEAMLALSV